MLSVSRLSRGFLAAICLLATLSVARVDARVLVQDIPAASTDTLPSSRDLYERFFRGRNLLVVYGGSATANQEDIRRRVERWRRWRTDLTIKSAGEVTDEDLGRGAVLLTGTPNTLPLLKNLSEKLPVRFRDDGFSFLGKTYDQPGDVINLTYPNPYNPAYPMFVVAGREESDVREALSERMMTYDFQVVRDGQRIRIGHFDQDVKRRWRHDPENDFDFESDTRLVGATSHFRFYARDAALDHGAIAEIIQERKQVAENVLAFLGQPIQTDPPFSYLMYGSVQNKAVITNDMEFAHADFERKSVHVVVEDGIRGDEVGKETLLMLRRALGAPALRVLEDGLGIYLNDAWFGRPYGDWMARIAHGNLALPAAVLLDSQAYEEASPLLREPLAAGLVACMIDEWGKANFLENYPSWAPSPRELAIIETVWDGCLKRARTEYEPEPQRAFRAGDRFQRGFNFAHEGYGIINGYGSDAAKKSLRHLAEMGSNAVSIIPYSFMRDTVTPTPFRLPNTVGDENDTAVAHASLVAQKLGFTSMIKPQIWVRGSWPGDIEMATDADWERFFAYYEHWIGHYAMLAEIFGVDILCIGTELTRATMGHEGRWIELADNLRSIYRGHLVYAPNWGEEFESLAFWDAFDFIGLNSYYPLSEADDPTEEELRKGADAVVKRIERTAKKFKKPVLLTEIGFASTPNPWKLPFQENREAPANPEHQALCYRIMAEALKESSALRGIYWWKWPSYLERGGMDQKGFTPNGKPASDVVANWYRSFEP